MMTTIQPLSTGIPAGRPIPVDPDRCFNCGAPIRHITGRCFICQLGVKLRAVAAAEEEVRWARSNCCTCAAAFGYTGPADGRLCRWCGEVV